MLQVKHNATTEAESALADVVDIVRAIREVRAGIVKYPKFEHMSQETIIDLFRDLMNTCEEIRATLEPEWKGFEKK